MKPMKRRDVIQALAVNGCTVLSDDGPHTKWGCPCGEHTANIPRHNEITAGVLRNTVARLTCLPEGWCK